MQTTVITKPEDFRDWCSKLKPIWALDTECASAKPGGNALNWLDLEIIGFSIADGTQVCYVDIHKRYKKELLQILDFYISEAKMIVMQNAPFDMMVLLKEGIEI